MVELPEITRRQLALWSLIGIAIIMIGGKYLLGQSDSVKTTVESHVVSTTGLKQDEARTIKIHVVGAVAAPGLYDLTHGARTADAIQVAGGPVPTADLSRINLAAKLADGQQLFVPDVSDTITAAQVEGSGSAGGGLINLNSASPDQLTELDGIGPKTAEKIVKYREETGGFNNVEELMDVPGIGPAKFDQIKDSVIV
jgi:competence protein ComEA